MLGCFLVVGYGGCEVVGGWMYLSVAVMKFLALTVFLLDRALRHVYLGLLRLMASIAVESKRNEETVKRSLSHAT